MRVHDALRLSGRSAGEQNQGVVVQMDTSRAEPPRRLRFRARHIEHGYLELGQARRGLVVRARVPDRYPGLRPRRERLDLERSEARIDWNHASAHLPDRQQLDEELVAVAEVKERPLAGPKADRVIHLGASRNPAHDLLRLPAPAGARLHESPDL